MKIPNNLILFILFTLTVLTAACSTTPASRFYTLSPLAAENPARESKPQAVTLGVRAVEVSPYLERSEIVTRKSATRVELATYDRWAEPLESLVAMTLARNITRLQPSIKTLIRPWAEANVDYMLEIKIGRFESDASGNVTLQATWGLFNQQTREMVTLQSSNILQSGDKSNFDAIVYNMSLALLTLSEEIVSQVERNQRPD